MARIIWTPRSLADLEAVLVYIERDSPAAALRFAEKIFGRVELLRTHPLIHGYLLEDETRTYREIIKGNYRVIYRADETDVYIIAVHTARLPLDPRSLAD